MSREHVALKIIDVPDTAAILSRAHEWKSRLANIRHPGISRVVDAGAAGPGHVYLATEYIAGSSLDYLLRHRPLSANERTAIARQLADALAAAHAVGLAHMRLDASHVKVATGGGTHATILGLGTSLIVSGWSAATSSRHHRTRSRVPRARCVRAVTPAINDRREITGWVMYDWANSGFQTTVITVLLGPYLTALAQGAVGENGIVLSLGPLGVVTAKSLFPYCVSLSVFLQVFLLPVLGAIADYTSHKKRLMAFLCYFGAAATCLMFFVPGHSYVAMGLLFVVANLCYGASLVMYNAFLNDITTPDAARRRRRAHGYALGYLGGGVLLALNLALVLNADSLRIVAAGWPCGFRCCRPASGAGRLCSHHIHSRLRARPAPVAAPIGRCACGGRHRAGRRDHTRAATAASDGEIPDRVHAVQRRYPDRHFHGIRVSGAGTVRRSRAARQRVVSHRHRADDSVHRVLRRVALRAHRTRRRNETRDPHFAGPVDGHHCVQSYALLQTTTQAWMMGVVLAIVLGGSQALSRSLFSQMIPAGREA